MTTQVSEMLYIDSQDMLVYYHLLLYHATAATVQMTEPIQEIMNNTLHMKNKRLHTVTKHYRQKCIKMYFHARRD
jgi:hypothetical protein